MVKHAVALILGLAATNPPPSPPDHQNLVMMKAAIINASICDAAHYVCTPFTCNYDAVTNKAKGSGQYVLTVSRAEDGSMRLHDSKSGLTFLYFDKDGTAAGVSSAGYPYNFWKIDSFDADTRLNMQKVFASEFTIIFQCVMQDAHPI